VQILKDLKPSRICTYAPPRGAPPSTRSLREREPFRPSIYNASMFPGQPIHWNAPATWPWIVYVWIAFLLLGYAKPIWKWIQQQRAKAWLTALGEIQSVSVTEKKSLFNTRGPMGNSPEYMAELGYSYSVGGKLETGSFKREFATEAEAAEFVRDLKGRPTPVQYNPNDAAKSVLLDSSVGDLLRTRPPKTTPDYVDDPLPGWMPQWLLWVFIGLSAAGLILSLWVHIGALHGRAPGEYYWALHMGIFVVWFPAVFVAKERVGSTNRKDFWKVALKGSPDWVRYMVYGFLAYAAVNFALFVVRGEPGGSGANTPALTWRGFSGHWMLFYSAALAILYSAAQANALTRRCSNGHAIGANANFCARCGQPAMNR
jgi:hypothetical protein